MSATPTEAPPAPVREREEEQHAEQEPARSFEASVVVLNDDVTPFEHVVETLLKVIPGLTRWRSFRLTMRVHRTGAAVVWHGARERAELYVEQIRSAGIRAVVG